LPLRIVAEWLATCGGCECSLLDIGEPLLSILKVASFVHIPVLMDTKYYGQTGEVTQLTLPEADVGIVSGAVRNDDNRLVLVELRKKAKVLVACGSCACFGGIPALANGISNNELLKEVYSKEDSSEIPSRRLPALEERVYAIDEVVKVDAYLPGCPPSPANISDALSTIAGGKLPKLSSKSVCDSCFLAREKKDITTIRRGIELPSANEWGGRCILEQGYLCLGPVTRAGCASGSEGPRCVQAGYPCRGCYGPLEGGDQYADMLNALATIGVDPATLPDLKGILSQFTGAKNLSRWRSP